MNHNIQRKIIELPEIDSTNIMAMHLAGKGESVGTVVVAETQTKGRGRLGKQWLSPPGSGLYFSLILRPSLSPADLPKITLAAGLGSAMAVESLCGQPVMLKWPNDLLINGKKFGGILCESGPAEKYRPTPVIVGVGLNVSTPIAVFPEDLRDRVTSITIHSEEEICLEKLLEAVANDIEKQVIRLEDGDFPGLLADWRRLDYTRGRELQWLTVAGKIVCGLSLGPDEDGILQIRDADGEVHAVLSGDISLVTEKLSDHH